MDRLPHLGSTSSNPISRKPRSSASRRPRPTEDLTSPPQIQPIHHHSSEGHKRKELYLNNLPPSSSSKKKSGPGSNRSTEGLLAPVNYTATAEKAENNKLRKVKLKVGGVTRTIHAKAGTEGGDGDRDKHKSKGEHWFSGPTQDKNNTDSSSTRKSRRVPKRRSLDDDMDNDNETKYLEKSKIRVSKHATHSAAELDDTPDEGSRKRKLNKITLNNNNNNNSRNSSYEMDEDFVASRSNNNNRRGSNNSNNNDDNEEELLGDENGGYEGKHLTSRQRAMQGKGGNGDNLIEFPNGLPPAPSRKQKEKLSEVEIQAKKAEAAQRRKMQVEKAAKEAEAEAIRKILGLDSDKKKEEKKQKEREEKEKAAKSQIMASNTIKCVMGPTGTVVTFPEELGLPEIFNSKPSNYPPPREKCAGPLCKNPYKYRDSKSKLPLCSLQCYKAVHARSGHALTC